MAKEDKLRELHTLRTFLSDCYSFIRAEITTEEISTFGLADQIAARIQVIEKPSTVGESGYSLLGRLEAINGQLTTMIDAAKDMLPYEDPSPSDSALLVEGTLGVSQELAPIDPGIEDKLVAIATTGQSAEDSAHNITKDEPPNQVGSSGSIPA